jgi:hypothetical protein
VRRRGSGKSEKGTRKESNEVGRHKAGVRWACGGREAELAVRQQYRCEAGWQLQWVR